MNEIVARIKRNHPEFAGKTLGVLAMHAKAESVNADSRTLWVVANTDDVDSDNEVVVPSGADTSYFERNKSIFVDHRYSFADIVGVSRKIVPVFKGTTQRAWKVHAYVLPLQNNKLGDDILTIAKEATIGVSIGFEPIDWGRPTPEEVKSYTKGSLSPESIVRRWRWVELSFTGMPCNVSCRSQQQTALETNAAKIDELLTKGRIARSSAEALNFRTRPMRVRATVQLASTN